MSHRSKKKKNVSTTLGVQPSNKFTRGELGNHRSQDCPKMQQHWSPTTQAMRAWMASPVGRLVRVEVLVTLSCTLLVTLVLLSSSRRASRSAAFRLVVWSALMLSYPAVSYTIGLMQSGSFSNELVIVWACFLLGCADGIASCSVDDSDQQARTMLNQAAQIIYVFFLLFSYASSLLLHLKILLLLIWLLILAKLGVRLKSFFSVGRDRVLSIENRLITMYMRDKKNLLVSGEADLEDGRGEYKFNVPNSVVTIQMVWQCKGQLLNSENPEARRLKDLCLSFALFKQLRRRLSGCSLRLHGQTHFDGSTEYERHIFPDDNTGNDVDSQERMYRIVEVELGFLFDFFYARYPSPRETLVPETILFLAVLTASLSTLFVPTLFNYHSPDSNMSISTTGFDIWLTRTVIILFVLLELFQYSMLVFSDWHKVTMLCRYVQDKSWQKCSILEMLLGLMCHVTLKRQYWSNSVGQYSLLHTCIRSENELMFRLPLPSLIRRFLVRNRMMTRRDLPMTVKHSIHSHGACFSSLLHGQVALQSVDRIQTGILQELCPTISHQSVIRSMLIWHIATTLCHYKSEASMVAAERDTIKDHEVATTLSDYCAYLLFYAPELVTKNYRSTQISMEILQSTAQQCLGGCRSTDELLKKLSSFQPKGNQDSGDDQDQQRYFRGKNNYDKYEAILASGRKLGFDILRMFPDNKPRWKMLAMLWTEKLMSVAPSDNVMEHVKKLATGGEFITHVWAWLTHNGIMTQPTEFFP
ncbi:unnamed protein product [Urochloa decumbens]|uniref:DUF4220 domain-containing protein n=1 Tax=Urochloa decumbens TaxID=240449 RepID=A0ABC8W892_9POAL